MQLHDTELHRGWRDVYATLYERPMPAGDSFIVFWFMLFFFILFIYFITIIIIIIYLFIFVCISPVLLYFACTFFYLP